MKFQCLMCDAVFSSTTPPTECPACNGSGKARYGQKMPTKLTHKQRRQIKALDPELVKAYREAQVSAGARVQVRLIPKSADPKSALGSTPLIDIPSYTDGVDALTREKIRAYAALVAENGRVGSRGDDVRPDAVSPESMVYGECTIKI
jgi:hypothetical protein